MSAMTTGTASDALSADEIASASNSNLAMALITLPKERRRDMNVFYAFCRLVDDLADEPGLPVVERRAGLEQWRHCLLEPLDGESALAPAVRNLIARYELNPELMREIIDGCEMDLEKKRYATWEDLRLYCYRVASCVGLISIRIFGCTEESAQQYAINLGLALQVTNILRDIREDYSNDCRIYLPQEDMERFRYSEADLAAGKRTPEFLELMRFEASRAHAFFDSALRLRPVAERRLLVAAELMRAIYSKILDKMERDNFRNFERRYRVSKLGKLALAAKMLAISALS